MNPKRYVVLVFSVSVILIGSACRRTAADPCRLVTKADVEKIVQTTVNRTAVEPEHAMSMAGDRVMHSTASCTYFMDPSEGKPARIKIEVDKYGDHSMTMIDFTTWKGAQRVDGIGDKAWQDTTALEILNKDTILLVETDQTNESPRDPIPPSPETAQYPAIQTELARIALGRL